MGMLSIGDLAQTFMLRRRNTQLKNEINQMTEQLASGRKADLGVALYSDFSYFADIERSMQTLDGYDFAIGEAATLTSGIQTTLAEIGTRSSDLGARLLASGGTRSEALLDNAGRVAGEDMASIVSQLNAGIAGRALFSGASTDQPPLASAEDMLAALKVTVASETSLAGIVGQVDAWFFASGGGFEAIGYLGSSQPLAPFQLGDDENIQFTMTAEDDHLREILRSAALAALSVDTSLGYSVELKANLQTEAGQSLLSAQYGLAERSADLGFVQERIDASAARNAIARSGLEMARTSLLEADPYETATRLESAQFQLEGLYSLTVRMSQLTLMDFMR